MRSTVVVGSPASVEAAFLERIRAVRAADSLVPVDVLVGGVLQRPYLQRRLAQATGATINVRLSTLGELGIRLGEPSLIAAGRKPLTAMAERGYAAEVARGTSGYFQPVAGTPGFADAARRLIRELRQEAIDPGLFAMLAPGAADSTDKAKALVSLYRRYSDGRADRYDSEDALAAADPGRFDGSALLVFGVWRLGANARTLIANLAERVPVTFFLPTVAPDPDRALEPLLSWLDQQGATRERADEEQPDTALAHVQRELFAPAAPVDPDDTVRLVSAPDPVTEVKEAARACLDWARSGIAFREMAVSYRDATLYRPLVEAVFSEAKIPLYLDDGPSVAERPLGRRILALLDLIDSDLVRRDVMSFLSDGWLPKETRERYGNRSISSWESASRRAGVVAGLEQWRQRLGSLAARERSEAEADGAPGWLRDRAEASETLLLFVDDLAQQLAAHPERGTWSECLAALKPLLHEYVQDVEEVIGHLDQLAQLDELLAEPVPFERFLDTVRAEIQALKAGDLDEGRQGAFGLRGVNVLDANQIRHLRFRAVIVLGLTERSFPPPPRQDPLFLDGERERLNAAGRLTLPLRAQGEDPEPLQFAVAVAAARERLLLSTRRAGEAGGRVQLPSSFFRYAASALAGRRLRADQIAELDARFYRRLPAGRIGADVPDRALTLAERDVTLLEQNPALGTALLHQLAPAAMRSDELRRARWGKRSLTAFDGLLADREAIEAIASWLAESSPLGPGILEMYAECPYRFFLSRLVGIKPIEEPEEVAELSALDRGAAIHAIFERFLSTHTPKDLLGKKRSDLQDTLRAIAGEELDKLEAQGLSGPPMLWRRSRTEIVDDLVRWLDREIADPGTFAERGFEVAFGGRWHGEESPYSRDEPLSLDIDGKELRLRGRMDRLEWTPGDAFRVIDYKSGTNRQRDVFAGGKALQLAIYLLAAADIVGIDVERGTAAYSFATRRGGFSDHVLSGADLRARWEGFEAVLGRIVGGVSGGDFHAEPGKHCTWCDFDRACDIGRRRQFERKSEDSRRVDFAAMKEIE